MGVVLISQVGLGGSEVKLNRCLEQLVQLNLLGAGKFRDSTLPVFTIEVDVERPTQLGYYRQRKEESKTSLFTK